MHALSLSLSLTHTHTRTHVTKYKELVEGKHCEKISLLSAHYHHLSLLFLNSHEKNESKRLTSKQKNKGALTVFWHEDDSGLRKGIRVQHGAVLRSDDHFYLEHVINLQAFCLQDLPGAQRARKAA